MKRAVTVALLVGLTVLAGATPAVAHGGHYAGTSSHVTKDTATYQQRERYVGYENLRLPTLVDGRLVKATTQQRYNRYIREERPKRRGATWRKIPGSLEVFRRVR